MIHFSGFLAVVLSLVLLVETLPANAASADPLPESNESVIDNAVAEQNAPADNDEPIVVDLDLPPELQAFLAEQEASRLAEADAADPPSETGVEAAQAQTPQRAQTESPQTPPVAT